MGAEERVTALHPGSQKLWEEMLSRVRWEDFEYGRERARQANRFAYLGNGFTASELGERKYGCKPNLAFFKKRIFLVGCGWASPLQSLHKHQ